MNLVFGGISEGVFAFFIIFCTLVGMATGAYLMDKYTFVKTIKVMRYRLRANLQNLTFAFRHLPASKYCFINRHDYVQKIRGSRDIAFLLYTSTCKHCNRQGPATIQIVPKKHDETCISECIEYTPTWVEKL